MLIDFRCGTWAKKRQTSCGQKTKKFLLIERLQKPWSSYRSRWTMYLQLPIEGANLMHREERCIAVPKVPAEFEKRFAYKEWLFPSILLLTSSLLLHRFFLSIDIGTAHWTTLPLYNYLEQRTQGNSLLLTILSTFVLPWLTFAFCIVALFFFLDDRMGGQRHGETLAIFLGAIPFHCRSCRACTFKGHYLLVCSHLPTAADTFCAISLLFAPPFSWSWH
jgi:hypothetical protein